MSASDSLHHVTFDADTDTLTFTCRGEDTAKCHNYPGCECETWSDDHEHPAVPQVQCWMQDWFDAGGVSYDGEDNVDCGDHGSCPPASRSDLVKTAFEDEYILWSWADEVTS
jgi:hypothetical protein